MGQGREQRRGGTEQPLWVGGSPLRPPSRPQRVPRGEASLLLPVPDSFSGDGFEVANMGGEFPLKNKKIKKQGEKKK